MMHTQFLLVALENARLGRGKCAPNPSVGAVAVKDDQIIAQAWHHGPGTLHAEPLVLAQFAAYTPGVTLYVTLEPCNHWGRTPPCVEAIIRHGVERVVYAYSDPNPVVRSHDTKQCLEDHRIEVIHAPLPAIDNFYRSYTHWCRTQQPWVTAKIAHSLDGKITGKHGQTMHLSNRLCSEFTHKQRSYNDVILTTAKTINKDNPALNVRRSTMITSKVVAILDRNLTVLPTARIWQTAAKCHIFHDQKIKPPGSKENIEYHAVALDENGRLDLRFIVLHLGYLGYHDVWVEAGSELFSALHHAKLVNQTYVYITPHVVGGSGLQAYCSSEIFSRVHQLEWQCMGDNMIMNMTWENEICLQDS